jgi:diaminohydroxyphosphoribosylaminopyrimidine deaminase/5-amino-6-(5-phosphoribosylamino)uracil reductase
MNAPQFSNAVAPETLKDIDARFMAAALSYGRRHLGQTMPNPSVATIIVNTSGDQPVVVSRGVTAKGGRPHAETQAIRIAGDAAKGSTIYVTLEPCAHVSKTPPCAAALVAAKPARVVMTIEDPNPLTRSKGVQMLRDAGIEAVIGVGAEEARVDHAGHIRRVQDGRPHIILKLAVSADGKSGLEGRRPARISGPVSMHEAHILRATSDAILVGSGTVLADNPKLDCRLPGMADRSPIRVVLDGSLRIPLASHLVKTARELPLIVIAGADAGKDKESVLRDAGAEVIRVDCQTNGKPHLKGAMTALGSRGITRLLIEGGPLISASLLNDDLVDEAIVVRAPVTLGANAIDALEGMPFDTLLKNPKLRLLEERTLGADRMTRLFRK